MQTAGESLLEAVGAERGHFVHESGHHGDLWLELELLLVDARRVRALASALAHCTASTHPELVCGPLTGGAFVAQALAAELGAGFVFAERAPRANGSADYRIPTPLRAVLAGRRVLVVDDAVNAGAALLATLADVLACGGVPCGVACLLALGDTLERAAARHGVACAALATLARGLWLPAECPLCTAGAPLCDRRTAALERGP